MFKKLPLYLVCIFLLMGCSNKPKLVIYSNGDLFPSEVLTGFEKDTGIRVQRINFNSNDIMMSRLRSDKKGSYSLVIAGDDILGDVVSGELAQKIDTSKLSNYQNINPVYQKQSYDPDDEYTIPYGASVHAIVYDPKMTGIPIRSYLDLWHPVLAGKLGIIDNYRVVNGMALRIMGESYNTSNPEPIRIAGELLKLLTPNIRLIRSEKLEDELISGGISAVLMPTAQIKTAKTEKPELNVVFPQEGLCANLMAVFIPASVTNTDSAYAFLNYILDPKRGALCFEKLGLNSTFAASDQFIDAAYREILAFPENSRVDSVETMQKISEEAENLHKNIWSEFKTAAGQ